MWHANPVCIIPHVCRPSSAGVQACSVEDVPSKQQHQQKHLLHPRPGSCNQGGARPLSSAAALQCLHPLPGPTSDQLLAQLRQSLASPLGSMLHTRTATPKTEYRTHFSRGGERPAPPGTPGLTDRKFTSNAVSLSPKPTPHTARCQEHPDALPQHKSPISQVSASQTANQANAAPPGCTILPFRSGLTPHRSPPESSRPLTASVAPLQAGPSADVLVSHPPLKPFSPGAARPASARNPITHSLPLPGDTLGALNSRQHRDQPQGPPPSLAANHQSLASATAAEAAPTPSGTATVSNRPRPSGWGHHQSHQQWQGGSLCATSKASQRAASPSPIQPHFTHATASPVVYTASHLQQAHSLESDRVITNRAELSHREGAALAGAGCRLSHPVGRPATGASTWSTDAIASAGRYNVSTAGVAQQPSLGKRTPPEHRRPSQGHPVRKGRGQVNWRQRLQEPLCNMLHQAFSSCWSLPHPSLLQGNTSILTPRQQLLSLLGASPALHQQAGISSSAQASVNTCAYIALDTCCFTFCAVAVYMLQTAEG
jgi:hypothetical protein